MVKRAGVANVRKFPFQLHAGESLFDLHVQVGTPGLGKGTFAALGVAIRRPADVHPLAEIIAPSKADPKKTVKVEFSLKERSC